MAAQNDEDNISTVTDDSSFVCVGGPSNSGKRNRQKFNTVPARKFKEFISQANEDQLKSSCGTQNSGFDTLKSGSSYEFVGQFVGQSKVVNKQFEGISNRTPNGTIKSLGSGSSNSYLSLSGSKYEYAESVLTTMSGENDSGQYKTHSDHTAVNYGGQSETKWTEEFKLSESMVICQTCADDERHSNATHSCKTCRKYICFKCLVQHERWTEGHDVISLSVSSTDSKVQQDGISNNVESQSQRKSNGDKNMALATNLCEVTVKEADDKKHCMIIDMCQSENGALVLADSENCKLKQVNLLSMEIQDSLVTWSYPQAIACIGGTKIIMADAKRLMTFVSMSERKQTHCPIKLEQGEDCSSIAAHGQKIFLSLGRQVKIFSIDGQCMRTIGFSAEMISTMTFTQHICIHDDTIYVSDANQNLLAVDFGGTVLWESKYEKVKKPGAICSDGQGGLVVIGARSNNVAFIGANHRVRHTLSANDGIVDPYSISVAKTDTAQILAVGMWNKDVITVFKL